MASAEISALYPASLMLHLFVKPHNGACRGAVIGPSLRAVYYQQVGRAIGQPERGLVQRGSRGVVMADLPDADTEAWAEPTSARADLGDPRRTRQLVHAAARIAAHPEKAFPQVFPWNDLRGFYRLCDPSPATTTAVQGPRREQTRHAMGRHPVVLILHDTTELDDAGLETTALAARRRAATPGRPPRCSQLLRTTATMTIALPITQQQQHRPISSQALSSQPPSFANRG